MTNDLSLMTTTTGRYHAGMTLNEARKKDLEKSWWRRDFHNIDKNHDGYLSADEIIAENKRDAKMSKVEAGLWCGMGVVDLLMEKSKALSISWLLFDGFMAMWALSRARDAKNKANEQEEFLRNNRENAPKVNIEA